MATPRLSHLHGALTQVIHLAKVYGIVRSIMRPEGAISAIRVHHPHADSACKLAAPLSTSTVEIADFEKKLPSLVHSDVLRSFALSVFRDSEGFQSNTDIS